MTVAAGKYSPVWIMVNRWPSMPGPVKSASPSPSASSVTPLEGTPPSVNRTVKGATPAAGIGGRDGTGGGDVKTLTATLCLAVVPSDRGRGAGRTRGRGLQTDRAAQAGPPC